MPQLADYKTQQPVPIVSRGDAFGKSEQAGKDAEKELAVVGDGFRGSIYAMQKAMADRIASGDLKEVEMPLTHTFAPGVYVRTAYLKAGSIVVGKIHKHSHANILSQGDVTVMTESGGQQRLTGFMPMVSEAGTKRAVYTHTDAIWTTIHLTNSTDLAEIEDELIAKTYADYEAFLLTKEDDMKKLQVQS